MVQPASRADTRYKSLAGLVWTEQFHDLRANNKTTQGLGLAVSETHLALATEGRGGGIVGVVPVGQLGQRTPSAKSLTGHKAGIQDYDFSPFEPHILATVSDDATAKIWNINNANGEECVSTLEGNEKRIYFCRFNPVASHVLATGACGASVRVFDVAKEAQQCSVSVPHDVQSLCWDEPGAQLGGTASSGHLFVCDPRTAKEAQSVQAHQGTKPPKCCWAGERLVSLGFTKSGAREACVWDARQLGAEVSRVELDRDSGSFFPFFDPSTSILLLLGKGDWHIPTLTLTPAGQLRRIGVVTGSAPQKAFAVWPKRCVDPKKAEILRVYRRLTPQNVQLVSLFVPRPKSAEGHVDAELYPDCYAAEPGMTSDDWVANRAPPPPKLFSFPTA
eukprot:Selendium_serpulae@DN4949_c3_g1_i1.p1